MTEKDEVSVHESDSTDLAYSRVRGGRLHSLVHPKSGKVYYIVSSPHEVEERRHTVRKENPTEDDFEILLHGTEDFINLVRELQRHHEAERESLLDRHPETLNKYEQIKSQMDMLNSEMRHLTERAIALDANFDKFGYSADLRTKTDSETSSLDEDGNSSQRSRYEDRSVRPLKFFSQPVVKQYFHKGLLWRSPDSSEVASFELFTDLVYVVVIDYVGYSATEYNPSAASFLHYVIVFSISWKVYSNITMTMNMFEIDDIFLRLSILFVLCCLYGFATNVLYFFQTTYVAGLSFYLAIQMFFFFFYIWIGVATKMVRGVVFLYAAAIILSVVLWIASIHVEYPKNLGLIFVAIVVDILGFAFVVPLLRGLERKLPSWKWLKEFLAFTPALNIEHRVERTNAFTALVFGYSVLTIIFQNRAEVPLNAFLGKGILALVQAFVYNWIYFEMDGANIHVHAIRRSFKSAIMWTTAQMPFAAGYILAAASLSKLLFTYDSANGDLESLSEDYQAGAYGYVNQAVAWFYCGGLGVALLSMTVMSLCHVHKKLDSPRLLKRPRLAARAAVAIVIICLPLAHLNSLHLIATTTGLVTLVLILDIFGMSCPGDRFFTGGFCKEHKRRKMYTAQCKISKRQRQAMQKKLEAGEKVTLEEALRRDSASSMESGSAKNDYEHHHL